LVNTTDKSVNLNKAAVALMGWTSIDLLAAYFFGIILTLNCESKVESMSKKTYSTRKLRHLGSCPKVDYTGLR